MPKATVDETRQNIKGAAVGFGRAVFALCWLVFIALDYGRSNRAALVTCAALAAAAFLLSSWRLFAVLIGTSGREADLVLGQVGARAGELAACLITMGIFIRLLVGRNP